MNKQRGDVGLFMILMVFVLLVLGIGIAMYQDSKEATQKRKESEQAIEKIKNIDTNSLSDSDILEARKFVADFESRIDVAKNDILKCKGTSTDRDLIAVCTRNAYDAQGFESGSYSNFTDVQLSPRHVAEFNTKRTIALKILSTE